MHTYAPSPTKIQGLLSQPWINTLNATLVKNFHCYACGNKGRDIFPNAICVVSLIERLVHRSEIINIDAESFRLKEAMEESTKRRASREKKIKLIKHTER